jgi:hypothetical protein
MPTWPIPLPITLPDTALGIESEDKIRDTLQADPERLRTRKAVGFAVEEAAEGGNRSDPPSKKQTDS